MIEKTKNLIENNEPLIIKLENDIICAINELYINFSNYSDSESKIEIKYNLYGKNNIKLSNSERQKYRDIISKKIKEHIVDLFIEYVKKELNKELSELTNEYN